MPQTDTGERVIPVVDFPSRDGLIVMHLLEKEPDRRYKSAETLAGDLARLRAAPGAEGCGSASTTEHVEALPGTARELTEAIAGARSRTVVARESTARSQYVPPIARTVVSSGRGTAATASGGVMAVAQRPFAEAAFGGVSGPTAWRSIPFWYILGTEDKAIPPATQREMANRGGATIVDVRVSQASMGLAPGRDDGTRP